MINVLDWLSKNNIPFTVNNNPTPEQIEKIRNSIKKREMKTKELQEKYKGFTWDKDFDGLDKLKKDITSFFNFHIAIWNMFILLYTFIYFLYVKLYKYV